MSHPSSLFARSAPGDLTDEPSRTVTTTHPSSGAGSSLFARATRRVRTVALDDIVDDLLASRLTRLTQLDESTPAAPADPAPPAVPDLFDDLDDVVALDLLDDLEGDDDFDEEHLRQLEDLLDLDEIDAHHVATRDQPHDDGGRPHRELVRESRIIRNRWDVRDRRIGLEQRAGHLDLRDHFAVTDREAAESLACLVEWLLARPAVSDLVRATPRGLFSLHALGRASAYASQIGRVEARPLDHFFTFET